MPECGFQSFGECDGTNCPTTCSARMYEPPPIVNRTFWMMMALIVAVSTTITGATYFGLSKAEREYQIDRRV